VETRGLQHGWGDRCDYVRHTTGPFALVHCAGARAGDDPSFIDRSDNVRSEQDVWEFRFVTVDGT
jgi:hypothetical protein